MFVTCYQVVIFLNVQGNSSGIISKIHGFYPRHQFLVCIMIIWHTYFAWKVHQFMSESQKKSYESRLSFNRELWNISMCSEFSQTLGLYLFFVHDDTFSYPHEGRSFLRTKHVLFYDSYHNTTARVKYFDFSWQFYISPITHAFHLFNARWKNIIILCSVWA